MRISRQSISVIRRLLIAALIFTLFGSLACGNQPDPESAPVSTPTRAERSLLLITLDTTRLDRLGTYGSGRGLTPNLDRLSERSIVFEQAIVQAAVTPVSHASILTGLEPFHHGLRVMHGHDENRLSDQHVTLAEVLQDQGYRTAAFVSAFPVSERFGLAQGFEVFDADFDAETDENPVGPDGAISTGLAQRGAGETTDLALSWLEQTEEPFFLWLHYFDAHDPYLLPSEEDLGPHAELPSDERERWLALYDLEIRYMDREIGRLLDHLEASGRNDDLVQAVIADHGEGLGDHDWWSHGILYQEQIHVPLIVHEPGRQPGRVGELVRSIDLMPTLLEMLGQPVPEIDGRSLLPLLDGAAEWQVLTAYADSVNVLTYSLRPTIQDVKDDMLFALIRPPWKYIHRVKHRDRRELFRLDQDPSESINLHDREREVVREMQLEMRDMDVMPGSITGKQTMSEADKQRLRALGYLD